MERLETGGLILGLFEHATFEEETVRVSPGDILLTFSDGVTEALSPLGKSTARNACSSARRSSATRACPTCSRPSSPACASSPPGAVQSDDVTALVLRYVG